MFPEWSKCKFHHYGMEDPPKTLPTDDFNDPDDLPGPIQKPELSSAARSAGSAMAMTQSATEAAIGCSFTEPAMPAQGINAGPLALPRPTRRPMPTVQSSSVRDDATNLQQIPTNPQGVSPGLRITTLTGKSGAAYTAISLEAGIYMVDGHFVTHGNPPVTLQDGTIVSLNQKSGLVANGQAVSFLESKIGSIGLMVQEHSNKSPTIMATLNKDGKYSIMGATLNPGAGSITLPSGTVVSVEESGQLRVNGQLAQPSLLPDSSVADMGANIAEFSGFVGIIHSSLPAQGPLIQVTPTSTKSRAEKTVRLPLKMAFVYVALLGGHAMLWWL
ncbi:hypothetical protein BT63DRAFT_101470 [Microthyrium microscopicum]|uniref:Uncharacterized protein n=1 Tax=Microthyrium microscopicum TaxID=703497 RepID=A0A6A6TZM5_9PEZI|nr:hypothetical protein BT63DRAFT_101470 [Microthyrium microscopicum]